MRRPRCEANSRSATGRPICCVVATKATEPCSREQKRAASAAPAHWTRATSDPRRRVAFRLPASHLEMNAGRVHMTDEHPEQEPFDADAILAEAARRTGGLDDLGDGPFLEPLALFLESLEREARLNAIGRLIAPERAVGHTVNRLGYVDEP